jgi:MFS family permease
MKHPFRAIIIWLISALFMFYKYTIEVSPSVMTHTLMASFQINAVELGNLTASYFYAYLLLQIPAGILLDRFGPRKTTTLAILLCSTGSLLFAHSSSFLIACIARFITGFGAAFAVVNCLKLIANWFEPKRFALMTGLMMTMAMLGAVGGQAPLSAFIQKVEWRQATEILGLVGFVLAMLFWLIVRDRPKEDKEEHNSLNRTSVISGLKNIFKNPQSWWLSLYSGFAFAPVMVFGGLWGVSFIEEAFDAPSHLGAQMVSLIFIGFAAGSPFFGWLSDRIEKRHPIMVFGTLLSLISICLVIYLPNIPIALASILLFGFGFFISGFLLCFTMIREINLAFLAATATGFMNAFDALIGALSDPLAGKILDAHWDGILVNGAMIFSVNAYKTAFLIIPLYLILSLLILFKIKESYQKR